VIRFALNTGLLTGEIFTLRWSHVDFEKNVLTIFAPKTQKTSGPDQLGSPQGSGGLGTGQKRDFVFYNLDTGKPFVDLKTGFQRACKKAGIADVTWHYAASYVASRLLNRGVDIVTVQQLFGHSGIIVTMHYTHTNLESKHAAVAKLEKFGDNLVTVCTKMQQSSSQLSLNAL
jgi:integrase